MLKRSKLLVAFLIVTVLCAGIGFAAVTDTLSFDGSVAMSAEKIEEQLNTEVKFTNVSTVALPNGATGAATAAINGDEDNVTLTIGENCLVAIGDTATVTVDILNASTSQAVKVNTITAQVLSGETESVHFDITATTANNATEIAAGETLTLTVVVTLVQLPADAVSETIDVSFTVESIIE